MTTQDLYDKWGSWISVQNELKVSQTAIRYWRIRGSIPFATQLLIQEKTEGLFIAKREDDKGAKWGGTHFSKLKIKPEN